MNTDARVKVYATDFAQHMLGIRITLGAYACFDASGSAHRCDVAKAVLLAPVESDFAITAGTGLPHCVGLAFSADILVADHAAHTDGIPRTDGRLGVDQRQPGLRIEWVVATTGRQRLGSALYLRVANRVAKYA